MILFARTFYITLIEEDNTHYKFFSSKVKNRQEMKDVLVSKGFIVASDNDLYNPHSTHDNPISSLWYLNKCMN